LDVNKDIEFYIDSLDLTKQPDGRFSNLEDVGKLIRTFNKLGEITSNFPREKEIIDKHNLLFQDRNTGKRNKKKDKQKRDALYNFISIKSKNISKDSINLIQS
jgi:hypothetical protein